MMNNFDRILEVAPKYYRLAIETRKNFIKQRLNQDDELRELYFWITKNITRELKKYGHIEFKEKQLNEILATVEIEADLLNQELKKNFKKYLKSNIDNATDYSKAILLSGIETADIFKVNKETIIKMYNIVNTNAFYSYEKKYKLADKIWEKSRKYRDTINSILEVSVLEGKDCTKVAKMIETYARKGRKTFVDSYPNMIKRIGNRVPIGLNYESLRLARTEMTRAYGEGVKAAAMINPGTNGVRFMLSQAHPKMDICDDKCECDDFGMGFGVYPLDQIPEYPFHPNCLCIMMPVIINPNDLVNKLLRWNEDPFTEPDLESWFQDVYLNYIA